MPETWNRTAGRVNPQYYNPMARGTVDTWLRADYGLAFSTMWGSTWLDISGNKAFSAQLLTVPLHKPTRGPSNRIGLPIVGSGLVGPLGFQISANHSMIVVASSLTGNSNNTFNPLVGIGQRSGPTPIAAGHSALGYSQAAAYGMRHIVGTTYANTGTLSGTLETVLPFVFSMSYTAGVARFHYNAGFVQSRTFTLVHNVNAGTVMGTYIANPPDRNDMHGHFMLYEIIILTEAVADGEMFDIHKSLMAQYR